MLFNFAFILCMASLLYAYVSHNREFTATACAIRQIWSGGCRLSCRQSQYSSFSGLSGLHGSDHESSPGTSQPRSGTSHARSETGQAKPRTTCVCEHCPCAVIDSVLSTCRPLSDAYRNTLQFVSNYVMQMLSGYTQYFTNVMDCRVSCQRQAHLTTSRELDSSQNINFVNQSKTEDQQTGVLKGMKSLIRRKSVTENRTPSAEEVSKVEEEKPRKRSLSIASGTDSTEEAVPTKSCSRCVQKGYTCMKNCPRAKKK